MSNLARQILRRKAKQEFKKLRKESPQYKNFKFAEFFKFFKMGLVQTADTIGENPPDSFEEDLQEVESIIMDDDIEE